MLLGWPWGQAAEQRDGDSVRAITPQAHPRQEHTEENHQRPRGGEARALL